VDIEIGRAVDGLPGLVWCARPDGRIELLNRRWSEYTGLDPSNLSEPDWHAAIHPQDLPQWLDRWRSMSTSDQPWDLELRLRRSDGEYRWFLCRASPQTDPSAHVIRWCGINTDIDDRRRVEDHLHTIETNFSGWVESFPGLMVTMSVTGKVELFSRDILEYFGKTAEELREWTMTDAVHPDDLPRVTAAFTESVITGKPYSIEHRCRRHDGVYRWFQVRALAVRKHEQADITGWYVVLVDIDDVRRAQLENAVVEEALSRARSELAHVARVTTVAALTASITHEVNQPLSGIVTNAGTCLRMLSAEPPNVDGALETVRRTLRDANRAADVIARLRALFNKSEVTPESLDLNDAVREVIALSSSELQRNGAILQLELADNLPRITGDRVQLQQVILNLLRNASDAMADVHDRPRRLLVKTEPERDARVRVTVRDVGVGLDKLSVGRLFDAFYTTKSSGMGIGLSVSRSIIERHRGHIFATPNDGPGATFAFWIPCELHEMSSNSEEAVRAPAFNQDQGMIDGRPSIVPS
jgi:PAS domain S-box-containing protein